MKVQSATEAKVYSGKWYCQGFEPTCTPWTIANATLALGLKPNPLLIRDLLNLANDVTKRDKGGLGFNKAKEVIDQNYPQEEVNIIELFGEERLEPTEDPKFHLLAFKMSGKTREELLRTIEEKNKKIIRKNARVIKQIIDEGAKILASVFLKGQQDRHAICIVSYKVHENGQMNVQVIDSNRGILWISLEHLSKCVVPFNTYKACKSHLLYQN